MVRLKDKFKLFKTIYGPSGVAKIDFQSPSFNISRKEKNKIKKEINITITNKWIVIGW